MVLVFFIPFVLIHDYQDESQVTFIWLVKYFMPMFLASMFTFSFGRTIFYKLRLVNENAIGKMFE